MLPTDSYKLFGSLIFLVVMTLMRFIFFVFNVIISFDEIYYFIISIDCFVDVVLD